MNNKLFPRTLAFLCFLFGLLTTSLFQQASGQQESGQAATRLAGEPPSSKTPKTDLLNQRLKEAGNNAAQLRLALEKCKSSDEETACLRFLIENMPKEDLQTLQGEFLIKNIRTALQARSDNAWSRKIPFDVFLNDVLPYASVNEKREDWRTDFYKRFKGLVKNCQTSGEAAQELNRQIFQILQVKYSTQRKKPDQSPSESMESGLASCTGLSVILTDACRSVGVPARVVGTPLWVNKRGNHTWVEVWDEGHWKFTGACEYNSSGLNRGWFAGIASQADSDQMIHRIYATSFKKTDQHFPMVWKRQSKEVPSVDVTWRYTGKPKPKAAGEFTVAIRLVNQVGQRVKLPILITAPNGQTIASGTTRDESNDANDFFEVNLKPGSYNASIPSPSWSGNNGKTTFPIVVQPKDNQIHQLQLRKDGQK